MDINTLPLLPASTTKLPATTIRSWHGWPLVAPVLGMAASASLALLSWSGAAGLGWVGLGWAGPGLATPAAIYASFSIGLALVYLALVPGCSHGGRGALLLALGQVALGLLCWQSPNLLHVGLGLQTVIATVWLLHEQSQGERAIAGLMLGLSTGAVVGLGLALTY